MSLRLRALRISASALLTMLLLYGLTGVYAWQAVDRPLTQALAGDADVAAFRVEAAGGVTRVRVTLRDVPNLRESYLRLHTAVSHAARGPVQLEVADRRDARLLDDYYAVHYYVAEALTRGDFARAAADIRRIARARGVERVGFYVDEQRVYLQLHRGPHYLYSVIDRHADAGGEGWR